MNDMLSEEQRQRIAVRAGCNIATVVALVSRCPIQPAVRRRIFKAAEQLEVTLFPQSPRKAPECSTTKMK